MKKRVIASLLCMAMGLSLVACGGNDAATETPDTESTATEEAAEEETPADDTAEAPAEDDGEGFHLNVAISQGNPAYFDGVMMGGTPDYFNMIHMNEGLMKYGKGGDTQAGTNPNATVAVLQCGQAESYEYDEENHIYTFHLRDDIFWSDGEPVEAEDFLFALHRLVNPETASSSAPLFNNIIKNWTEAYNGEVAPEEIGVTCPDSKTIVFELVGEVPYFLSQLADMSTYPQRQEIVEADPEGWGKNVETVVTNGAYKLVEWNPDVSFKTVKNELYYDYENLGPDSITWHLTTNETTLLASFQSGDWDYVSGTPAASRQELETAGSLFTAPYLGFTICYMNVEDTPDWRVRAAYMLAIDRENLVDNVAKNGATPADGMVPYGLTAGDGVTEWREYAGETMYYWLQEQYPDYDLSDYIGRCELAQALYAEAVADGFDTSVSPTIIFGNNELNKLLAEAIQTDLLNVLGANLVIQGSDSVDWEKPYTLGRLGFSADYADQTTFFNNFGTNGMFELAHYSNAQYDELVAKCMNMPNGDERDEVMRDVERTMFSDQGFSICPLYYSVYTYCIREGISNLMYQPVGGLVNFTYATQE